MGKNTIDILIENSDLIEYFAPDANTEQLNAGLSVSCVTKLSQYMLLIIKFVTMTNRVKDMSARKSTSTLRKARNGYLSAYLFPVLI